MPHPLIPYTDNKLVLSQQIGVMLRDVVRSLDAMRQNSAFCVVLRVHAKRDVEWCHAHAVRRIMRWCAITHWFVMCDVALSRSASYCVGSCYHAVRQLVWCCFIAPYCVLSCYHAVRCIVWGYAITQCVVLCTVVLSRTASYCMGLRYHAVRRIV